MNDSYAVMEREEDALQKKANELFRKTYGRNLNDPDDEGGGALPPVP